MSRHRYGSTKLTRAQSETMDELRVFGCVSRETAYGLGLHARMALKLAKLGLVNRAVDQHESERFWIRQPGEPSVGASSARGWIVILNRNIPAPNGKIDNFFLARSVSYDGRTATFRKLLRGWLERLGLKSRNLISLPIEEVEYDASIFVNSGGHVFFDE